MNPTRLLFGVLAITVAASSIQAQRDNDTGMPWEALQSATRLRFEALPLSAQNGEPFKIFENVYYVGLETVASYLLPSKEGLILIDATYAETADLVLNNIRTLGHDPTQIKYIVVTHGHADHFGGAGRIRQVTGARVMMARADWDNVERLQNGSSGGASNGVRLTRDVVINDGDKLALGDIELWFYLIGGHTNGNVATEVHGLVSGREFRTLLGVAFEPAAGLTSAALKSIERLRELGPWDALLPSHAYLAPVALPVTARQILAGEPLPANSTKQPMAVGAQRVNAYLDQIRAAMEKRLATERTTQTPRR